MRNSTLQRGARELELSPRPETRSLVDLSLPPSVGRRLLDPPKESHVDIVVEASYTRLGDSLRDVVGPHTPAINGLMAVLERRANDCEIFLSLARVIDDESPNSDGEDVFLRTFLIKFPKLPYGTRELVILGTHKSNMDFGSGDWWRLFQRLPDGDLGFSTVRLMDTSGYRRFGHPQMEGLLNCLKQILNEILRVHDESWRKSLERSTFFGEGRSLDDFVAFRALMEEESFANVT